MAKISGKMTRSEQMSTIRSNNTIIEVMLREELWGRGLRYRKNPQNIIGKPDVAFIGLRIAVFCDSEFWHGKGLQQGKIPQSNKDYWVSKLNKNITRDAYVNSVLEKEGWIVLRFWEKDIKKDVELIADQIEKIVKKKKRRTKNIYRAKRPHRSF